MAKVKISSGPFGKLAVEKGFLTEMQLREAVRFQNEISKQKGERVNLGKILIERGFITKAQVKEILSDQAKVIELPGFKIVSKLGAGNMGDVYKATHLASDRLVALKILSEKHNEEKFIKRFSIEFNVLEKLKHPNIVEPVVLDHAEGKHFYAMEFVQGVTVGDVLKKEKTLSTLKSFEIILAACNALQYAASHSVFHRDIKPDNLIIEDYKPQEKNYGNLKIIDFGLAKNMEEDSGLTMEGTGMGTPLYMAPEQVRDAKNVDFRADIYSLGATLFKMLSGENAAFGKSSMEIVSKVVKGEVKKLVDVKDGLGLQVYKLVDKMMALDLKLRYADYSTLIKDMNSVIKKLKSSAKSAHKEISAVESAVSSSNVAAVNVEGFHKNISAISDDELADDQAEENGHSTMMKLKSQMMEAVNTSEIVKVGKEKLESDPSLKDALEPALYLVLIVLGLFFAIAF